MEPPVDGATSIQDDPSAPRPTAEAASMEAAQGSAVDRFTSAWRQWVGSLAAAPAAVVDAAPQPLASPVASPVVREVVQDEPQADGAPAASLSRTAADHLLALANIARFEWDLPSGRIGWVVVPIHDETLASVDDIGALLRHCHPRDLPRLRQDIDTHVQGRQAVARSEFRLRSVHGPWRWYALCGRIVDTDTGEPRRFAGLIQDIDERRRAMQVRSTQDALFAEGPVRLFTLGTRPGATSRDLYADLASLLAGDAPGESAQASPRRLRDVIHADDLDTLQRGVEAARRNPGRAAPMDLRVAEAPGGWRRVRLQLAAERETGSEAERADAAHPLHAYLIDVDDPAMAAPPESAQGEQLQAVVSQLGTMQRVLQELQRLNESLQLCDGEVQARGLVAQSGATLFPAWHGVVRLADGDGHLHPIVEWPALDGSVPAGPLGAPDADDASGSPPHHLSLPLVMGTQHGVLEMACSHPLDEASLRHATWAAASFAESLGLSLGNVRLREQAVQDWLTGLYNRRWFDEALRRESRRAQRSGEELTLAILDIDHFKSFNDAFGHDAGDEVLRAVAKEMLAFGRASDTPCRIGGEELAVLMPRARIEDACDRLEELRERISQLALSHEGVALPRVTVSIGVADCIGGRAQNLQRRADVALYAAKHGGRNRVRCWEPGLEEASGFAPLGDARPSSLGI